jgi:hypothetical protein
MAGWTEGLPPEHTPAPGEVYVGIYRGHPFYQCEHMGAVAILPLAPEGWTVLSEDPATVTPSIKNLECECHGFITDGRWIPV